MCCDLEWNLVKCDFARVCMFSPVSPKYAPGHNLHRILYPTLFFLQEILFLGFLLGRPVLSRHLFPLKGSAIPKTFSQVLPAVSIILMQQFSRPPGPIISSFFCINFWSSAPGVGGTKIQDFNIPSQFRFFLCFASLWSELFHSTFSIF